jgi:superfamily II DNA/RNA helicase
MTNMQRHMWPAIVGGMNVVAIGDNSSGKSLGYLTPLASKHLKLQEQVSVCVFVSTYWVIIN